MKAFEDAYKPYMMQHKYPFVCLKFEVPGDEVDINVHPTKMEVRFQKQKEIYESVYEALLFAIGGKELIPEVKFEEKKYRVPVFASLNSDIWSKLYDVREQTLINQIEQSDINMETAPVFISIFIELMWAYDDIENEKYYNAAFLIIEKLIELDNDNVAATIY